MRWNGTAEDGLPQDMHWATTALRWMFWAWIAAAVLLLFAAAVDAIYWWAAWYGIAATLGSAPVVRLTALGLDCAIYAARTARDVQSRVDRIENQAIDLRGVADTTAKRVDAVRTLAISLASDGAQK